MSGNVEIQVQPATLLMTGIEFMQYGNHYLSAAERLTSRKVADWFDPLPYQLVCQSLELHLKSYIWLTDQASRNTIKNRYGHNIEKLWRHAKERKIGRYCQATQSRDAAIQLLGPYYKDRRFTYLDLSMSFNGIPRLRNHPEALPVVLRLCRRLKSSLRSPILNAS